MRALLATLAAASLLAGCGGGGVDVPPKPEPEPRSRWGMPAGEFRGERPRAILLLIHGGSWRGLDRRQFEATLAQARTYRARGYATLTIDYRRGAQGLADVERFYELARRRFPRLPVCALGTSAGGHLALMLATRKPGLDCAVDIAGPTDLVTIGEQPGGERGARTAREAFGPDELERFSPARHADRIRAAVMAVGAVDDPLVPEQQIEALAKALPSAETVVLRPGPSPFAHGAGVDPREEAAMNERLVEFLDRVSRRG